MASTKIHIVHNSGLSTSSVHHRVPVSCWRECDGEPRCVGSVHCGSTDPEEEAVVLQVAFLRRLVRAELAVWHEEL